MNVKVFTSKLFELYTNSWNESNKLLKQRQYLVALDNSRVDFELLLDRIAKYHNNDFMPSPAWLRKESKYCYKKEIRNYKTNDLIHVKIYNPIYKAVMNTDCFPTGTTPKQIIATYKKLFPDTEAWRIEKMTSY